MGFFLPILFISLSAVTILIFLAFFPIRISWFYHTPKSQPVRFRRKNIAAAEYDFSREYRGYHPRDVDNYDDPEL